MGVNHCLPLKEYPTPFQVVYCLRTCGRGCRPSKPVRSSCVVLHNLLSIKTQPAFKE